MNGPLSQTPPSTLLVRAQMPPASPFFHLPREAGMHESFTKSSIKYKLPPKSLQIMQNSIDGTDSNHRWYSLMR